MFIWFCVKGVDTIRGIEDLLSVPHTFSSEIGSFNNFKYLCRKSVGTCTQILIDNYIEASEPLHLRPFAEIASLFGDH